MAEQMILGIDCGGTHTDAALLRLDAAKRQATLLASAKTTTLHDNLTASIEAVLGLLKKNADAAALLGDVERVTLGTTLAVNAIVQDKADRVGLALCAGPGLDPVHFALGNYVCIVPGGLDHRGVEVEKLFTDDLASQAAKWAGEGVAQIACVGKFSPRNPAHEQTMANVAARASGLPVSMGHNLSGKLNFPRRIATAYFNAAVSRIHQNFLDAVENSFKKLGINAQMRLLKADGGAIPFAISRREPVQSILSGPAASVMGVLALWPNAETGCSLLLDMGGTTTDLALFYAGSPVVDRGGMRINSRRTLVRSLASISIGVGGDSLLGIRKNELGKTVIETGPRREGPAMAFGGSEPTLLDALNYLDGAKSPFERGDIQKSGAGMEAFAKKHGFSSAAEAANQAVANALDKINRAAYDLVETINSRPIYTLAALKAVRQARPEKICLVGGPAECLKDRLAQAMQMPVEIAPHSQVANAIGAALTRPTAALEIYADTGKGELSAPAMNYVEKISRTFTLEDAKNRARQLLQERLDKENIADARVEVVEADLFATLDDYGRGSRDMRVFCQAIPGILAKVGI